MVDLAYYYGDLDVDGIYVYLYIDDTVEVYMLVGYVGDGDDYCEFDAAGGV